LFADDLEEGGTDLQEVVSQLDDQASQVIVRLPAWSLACLPVWSFACLLCCMRLLAYRMGLRETRFSCNLINKGLSWHHDFVKPDQNDLSLTAPGITLVIHLGEDTSDIVYVDFECDLNTRYPCRPGTVYVFPGYAIKHRTMREYTQAQFGDVSRPNRYSIGIWFPFKSSKCEEVDARMHKDYPMCDDNFAARWAP